MWPALVPDVREWDSLPGSRVLGLLIEAHGDELGGLDKARAALETLPVVIHPDHYLHVTLRTFGPPGSVDAAALAEIEAICRDTSPWTALVRGLRAFPTAIWADPDADGTGRFAAFEDRLLGPLGNLGEDPVRQGCVAHLTLAYAVGTASAESVRLALEPHQEMVLGSLDVDEAVLAETHLTTAYPRWRVLRRFRLGAGTS